VAVKDFAVKEDFIRRAPEILDEIHHNLLERSTTFRNENISTCESLEAFHAHWSKENPGWLITPWAGTAEEEDALSKQHKITIRCIPLDTVELPQTSGSQCILTGQQTATRAIWGRSY
jgi:prolyl-tRNA synthetase